MKIIKRFIVIMLSLISFAYGGRNRTDFEMGSPIYRDLCPSLHSFLGLSEQHWHVGVYEYLNISPDGSAIMRHSEMNAGAVHPFYISGEVGNYTESYNLSGGWNSIGDEMLEFKTNLITSFNECGISDAAYRGSYYNSSPLISNWNYYQVALNIEDLDNSDPEYTGTQKALLLR